MPQAKSTESIKSLKETSPRRRPITGTEPQRGKPAKVSKVGDPDHAGAKGQSIPRGRGGNRPER
jgi:hypothetical protein